MKKKLKSITQIDGNIILFKNNDIENNYSYENKKLKDFNVDDFVNMVFDNSDFNFKFLNIKGLTDVYEIDYLNHIPKEYPRVYLYGVWMVIKSFFKII